MRFRVLSVVPARIERMWEGRRGRRFVVKRRRA